MPGSRWLGLREARDQTIQKPTATLPSAHNHWFGRGYRCTRVLHINRLWFSALQIAAAIFSGSCQHGTLSHALCAKLAQAEKDQRWRRAEQDAYASTSANCSLFSSRLRPRVLQRQHADSGLR